MTHDPGGAGRQAGGDAPAARRPAAPAISPVVRRGRGLGVFLSFAGAAVLLAQRFGLLPPGPLVALIGLTLGMAGLMLVLTARLVVRMTRPSAPTVDQADGGPADKG